MFGPKWSQHIDKTRMLHDSIFISWISSSVAPTRTAPPEHSLFQGSFYFLHGETDVYSKKRVLFAGERIWRMAWRVCAKKAPTRLRWVRDSPWAQESSSGYSTSVCRSCCRACSICRRCGASLRSATTSLRPAAQKQVLFHVFAREDNGSKVLD